VNIPGKPNSSHPVRGVLDGLSAQLVDCSDIRGTGVGIKLVAQCCVETPYVPMPVTRGPPINVLAGIINQSNLSVARIEPSKTRKPLANSAFNLTGHDPRAVSEVLHGIACASASGMRLNGRRYAGGPTNIPVTD
jgi:hypothetical protein